MKNLLILTYYFPPLGLGGTQRVAKFVKYLPQFGWQPTVVTVKPIAYWATDESLMQDVKGARVIRTESFDPQRMMAHTGRAQLPAAARGWSAFMNQRVAPFFLLPDSKILWRPFAFKACRELVQKIKFDALLTTSPPHSVHLIGRAVAKKFKLAWVADFRDGWAGSHVVYEPTKWQARRHMAQQTRVVRDASAVVSVSPGIEASLKKSDQDGKYFLISNGFDADDLKLVRRENDKYTLCYSGTINKFADPAPLLEALLLLKQHAPAAFKSLRLQFVGLDTLGNFADMVRRRGLHDSIEIIGHRDHADALTFVQNAHALLLIANARPIDTFIPGKTFEYIGAQKPIFAISTSLYTNQLLAPYNLARIVPSFQPDKICASLKEFLDTNWNLIKIDQEYVNQFERKYQTRQLAEILNSIAEKSL
ncbi:hypothetical protein JW998_17665 [candidate division KSB1 bacterium]|nr:hypothetical protein [candidate division KSB1 bacterium]